MLGEMEQEEKEEEEEKEGEEQDGIFFNINKSSIKKNINKINL